MFGRPWNIIWLMPSRTSCRFFTNLNPIAQTLMVYCKLNFLYIGRFNFTLTHACHLGFQWKVHPWEHYAQYTVRETKVIIGCVLQWNRNMGSEHRQCFKFNCKGGPIWLPLKMKLCTWPHVDFASHHQFWNLKWQPLWNAISKGRRQSHVQSKGWNYIWCWKCHIRSHTLVQVTRLF